MESPSMSRLVCPPRIWVRFWACRLAQTAPPMPAPLMGDAVVAGGIAGGDGATGADAVTMDRKVAGCGVTPAAAAATTRCSSLWTAEESGAAGRPDALPDLLPGWELAGAPYPPPRI